MQRGTYTVVSCWGLAARVESPACNMTFVLRFQGHSSRTVALRSEDILDRVEHVSGFT